MAASGYLRAAEDRATGRKQSRGSGLEAKRSAIQAEARRPLLGTKKVLREQRFELHEAAHGLSLAIIIKHAAMAMKERPR